MRNLFFNMLISNTTTSNKYLETIIDCDVLYKLPYLCTYILESPFIRNQNFPFFQGVYLKTKNKKKYNVRQQC